MAFTVYQGAVNTVASGDLALDFPTTRAAGDIFIACITIRDTVGFATPAGWTKIGESLTGDTDTTAGVASGQLFWWRYDGGVATSVTFARTGGNLGHGAILGVRGCAPSGNVIDASSVTTDAGTALAYPNITASAGGSAARFLLMFAALGDNGTVSSQGATTPSGGSWSELELGGTNTGADGGGNIAYHSVGLAAGTTTSTLVGTSSTDGTHVVATVALLADDSRTATPTAGVLQFAGGTPTTSKVEQVSAAVLAGLLTFAGGTPTPTVAAMAAPTAAVVQYVGGTPTATVTGPPTLTVELREGATVRATREVEPTADWQTIRWDLTTAERDSITDWTALRVALIADGAQLDVSWVSVRAPMTSGTVRVSPTAGELVYAGGTPTTAVSAVAAPSVGALVAVGGTPTALVAAQAAPSSGALVYVGGTPTAPQAALSAPSAGVLAYTGGTPTVVRVTAWWLAQELTLTTGAIVSGTLDATRAEGTDYLVLSEVTGTTGFAYDFTFWDVPDATANSLHFVGYYLGNRAHAVRVQQWNFTTSSWEYLTTATTDILSGTTDHPSAWPLLGNTGDYLSSGQIRIRIIHTSPGNPLHELWINALHLSADVATVPVQGALVYAGGTPTATVGAVAAPTAGVWQFEGATPATEVTTAGAATPTAGAWVFEGGTPTITATWVVLPTTGAWVFEGGTPTTGLTQPAYPTAGALVFEGGTPTTAVAAQSAPTAGEVVYVGGTPAPTVAITATPSAGAVVVVGGTPTCAIAAVAEPTAGVLRWTGDSPTAQVATTSAPTAGLVTFAGATPTATVAMTAAPSTGVWQFVGGTPTVAIVAVVTATPTAGVLRYVGGTPTGYVLHTPDTEDIWTLPARDDAWTVSAREDTWTLTERADTWTPEARADTWTLAKRADTWTPE